MVIVCSPISWSPKQAGKQLEIDLNLRTQFSVSLLYEISDTIFI